MNHPSPNPNLRAIPSRLARTASLLLVLAALTLTTLSSTTPAPAQTTPPDYIQSAIARAGTNQPQITKAWSETPPSQKPGMAFLLEHMPTHDLRTLSADFLLENVDLAYDAWETAPWKNEISEELFLNEVLPYCMVTEDRTNWRSLLRETSLEIVAGARTTTEAAQRLNHELFPEYGVVYSTERSRTDQNAAQVIAEQKATCTGLSVLLTSACRSVGVPARVVGTPLWADSSGNHSWVEIWDNGWHFTGAAEPADELNDAWFTNRAARAKKNVPVHAIYATSYARTGTTFPIAWDPTVNYVSATNVTHRYTKGKDGLRDKAPVRILAIDANLKRVATKIELRDTSGRLVFTGTTKTESADLNDHLTALLEPNREYDVTYSTAAQSKLRRLQTGPGGEPTTVRLTVRQNHGWGRSVPFAG